VQIVTIEEERHHSMERGAFSYLAKPATTETHRGALERIKQFSMPRVKKLLVVEDDDAAQHEHRGADPPRRRRDLARQHRRRRRSAQMRPAPSTASCSTCACPT
jgi:hypothetical protein